ncbi:MAG: CPBP family intramembrane metalloprotease, partial [Gammaproteobacteria bacterium]|nr:CPBP family intramembrane metalloprotease [Gammaproteobacteria bacterium]
PYWWHHRARLASAFGRPAKWFGLILTSVAIGVSTRITSWGVTFVKASLPANYIHGDWVSFETGPLWQCPDAGPLLLAIVTMTVATPAIEEVINRGYILGAFVRRNLPFPALFSAGLFAVLHRPDGMIAAFLFGIVVAVQMPHCRSLWGPIIAHSTFNMLFIVDSDCLRYPELEAALLTLPALKLGALGVCTGVASFLIALRIAGWTGAAAP